MALWNRERQAINLCFQLQLGLGNRAILSRSVYFLSVVVVVVAGIVAAAGAPASIYSHFGDLGDSRADRSQKWFAFGVELSNCPEPRSLLRLRDVALAFGLLTYRLKRLNATKTRCELEIPLWSRSLLSASLRSAGSLGGRFLFSLGHWLLSLSPSLATCLY